MTPDEYIHQLEQFARDGEADLLLEFAAEHGPDLQDSLTSEQWDKQNSLGHWATMLVDMRDYAHEHASLK